MGSEVALALSHLVQRPVFIFVPSCHLPLSIRSSDSWKSVCRHGACWTRHLCRCYQRLAVFFRSRCIQCSPSLLPACLSSLIETAVNEWSFPVQTNGCALLLLGPNYRKLLSAESSITPLTSPAPLAAVLVKVTRLFLLCRIRRVRIPYIIVSLLKVEFQMSLIDTSLIF